jgi:hypothetical protein
MAQSRALPGKFEAQMPYDQQAINHHEHCHRALGVLALSVNACSVEDAGNDGRSLHPPFALKFAGTRSGYTCKP